MREELGVLGLPACLPAWERAACAAGPNPSSRGPELWQRRCCFLCAGPSHTGPSKQHWWTLLGGCGG